MPKMRGRATFINSQNSFDSEISIFSLKSVKSDCSKERKVFNESLKFKLLELRKKCIKTN